MVIIFYSACDATHGSTNAANTLMLRAIHPRPPFSSLACIQTRCRESCFARQAWSPTVAVGVRILSLSISPADPEMHLGETGGKRFQRFAGRVEDCKETR